MKYNIPQLSLERISSFLFFLLFFPTLLQAQTITEVSCWKTGNTNYGSSCNTTITGGNIALTAAYDPCNLDFNNITYRIHQKSGASDYFWTYTVKINGTQMIKADRQSTSNSAYTANQHSNVINLSINNSGGSNSNNVAVAEILTPIDVNNRFRIQVTGEWIPWQIIPPFPFTSEPYIDQYREYQLHFASNASAVTATPGCQAIQLNWSNGVPKCPSANGMKTFIFRSNSVSGFKQYIGEVDYNTTTFTETNAGFTIGDDYYYHVRHGYYIDGNRHFDNIATVAAQVKGYFTAPANFDATKVRCDNTIELTWDNVPNANGYRIFRDNVLVKTITAGTINDFLDEDPSLVRGQNYTYHIQTISDCGHFYPATLTNTTYFSSDDGISPRSPEGTDNVWVNVDPVNGVDLTWNTDPFATNGYKVERSLLGGGGSAFFSINYGDTTFQDPNLAVCETYLYRVLSLNDCDPNGIAGDSIREAILIPDLSTVFSPTGFSASKGYFSNRIELSWTVDNNANNINAFKIYRRVLNSNVDSILITSQNSGSNIYQDNLTDAGVLYEYFIIAELQCDQATVYSNVATNIGFRSATGTVSGQVSYIGGVAVKDVRISVENSSGAIGNSLELTGSDSILVPDNNNFDISNGLTAELWFNVPNHSNDFTLLKKNEVFSLKHVGSNYVFEVFSSPTSSQSISFADNNIPLNVYSQITATLDLDTLSLYANGALLAQTNFGGASVASNNASLVIGQGLTGFLDEFRLWSIGKDSTTVVQDFSRQLNGVNTDLEVYFRFNENTGTFAYDFSRTNTSTFHKNHGQIIGNAVWSSTIPSSSQLSIASYTDSLGNYFLSIPFSGLGETFVLTPSYLIHNFNPSTRALFIGDGSTIHNNIDFEDISSFTVTGSLFYANSTCPVIGATLLVDGSIVVANGQPVKTRAAGTNSTTGLPILAGSFEMQVPIGEHYITVEQEGHTMNIGRFPAVDDYDFQNDIDIGIFRDTTLIKVVGRSVGGLKQASLIPGLGKSINNIGQVDIEFKSQLAGGCQTTTVTTDYNTGEYTVYLPPLKYDPTVTANNIAIQFGVLNSIDLSNAFDFTTEYDTLGYDSLANVFFVDSISYNKQIDYIYRNDPQIVVKETDLVNDFIGDTLYTYLHPNGNVITRNLKTDPLPWPVFNGVGEDKNYTCLITAFESYVNNQQNTTDTVPTTDGNFIFNNELCDFPGGNVSLSEINTLDSLNYLKYDFLIGTPNFNPNSSIEEYSFVKKFELNLALSNGTTIPWKPDVFSGTPTSPNFLSVYDDIFRAYVLGTKSDGQQFITAGPQIPDYVLRDPPGSNSFASRDVGTTKTTENSWSYDIVQGSFGESNIYLGQKFNSGIGVAIETDVQQDLASGTTSTITGSRNGKEVLTVENNQAWSTDISPNNPGKNSDLYIGKSKNVTFGISETLKIVPDSVCFSVECQGDTNFINDFSLAKTFGVSIVPGGYSTQFLYSEDFIKNQLIPDLVELRNALLSNTNKYSTTVSINDPLYGLNNDDPRVTGDTSITNPDDRVEYLLSMYDESYSQLVVVGTSLLPTSETHYRSSNAQKAKWDLFSKYAESDTLSLSGNSYTYLASSLQDSLTGDSVRWINNQIQHWEDAILLNEWEKVNIDNTNIRDKMKGIALTKLYKSYEADILEYNILYLASIASAGAGSVAEKVLPSNAPSAIIGFAVVSGFKVAENAQLATVSKYITARDILYNKYAQSSNNYSISSGASFTSSSSHETLSSVKRTLAFGLGLDFSLELKSKINNVGVKGLKGQSFNLDYGTSAETLNTASETVSFTLNDQDPGDFFSVDVHSSLLGWGPVFKLRPGGKTSCPHEDALLTEYYLEDPTNLNSSNPFSPSYVLSEKTQQRDKPTIQAAPTLLTNIPITDEAVFNLTINNESESNDTRTYKLALLTTSNPFGAIVTIDGSTSFADVTIPGASSINKVLAIEKGPGPTYNYDSLIIVVYSDCEPDIRDSVYVSAHFLPTCTDVAFASPDDQWVLNNSFSDTMPIGIIDYNINFFDFNSIRLDYKPASQSQWVGLQTFHKDTTGLNDTTALEIPTNVPFILWDWETNQLVDGDYDLRFVSQCTLAEKISLTHSGLMDRINPHPFGTPSPADGILDPNDDISIQFNEPIDLGSLTSLNFDIRGVINGTETTHASNLFFDGVDDAVEVTAGAPLQNRDFTLEFSVKRSGLGEECIISQGSDNNEQIYVGFNASDQLEFKINNIAIASSVSYTDNDWHFFAVSYNYLSETAEMFEASGASTASLINSSTIAINPKYTGSDKLFIGKDGAGNASFFNGNIDEVRVWNISRTLNEFSVSKSILLSANEPGLLFNWSFDDAEGIFAEDHVRSRDGVISGAEWSIEPTGSNASFDGVDDYIRVQKGDVNITENMDFTLEFWFSSTQSTAATLVSNGKGDGLGSDSLYSWNIAKDAAGLIHVYHNGLDFIATNQDYFDGEWHHFALVLNRQGNLTSFIDANLENSTQALPFEQFGSSGLYIGARGYYVANLETFDSFFDGQIDEFRFWDASRKYEQIERDKQNRMLGDEFALRLYLPFEDYQLSQTGVPILTPSFTEQINDTLHVVTNPNGTALSQVSPNIKLQRPIEGIAFTYSVNNDEIIITPTTDPALIENVTLDITVKNVMDLNGNTMESPKTWIAYMDKNQVVWQDDFLSYEKDFGAPLSFTSALVNNGGATKDFIIENLPAWLSVSTSFGTLSPNSVLPITFTVDPLINIGDYFQDIHLLTDFGFAEKLSIELKVRDQEPAWEVDPNAFDYSMGIIGYLKIKEVVSTSEEDVLAAFVNGECRGLTHLEYVPQLDRYLAFLDVYSNVSLGEDITFQIWDASSGTIFSEVDPLTLAFVENTLIGTVNAPQLFETNYEIAVEVPLNQGWNWISHFLENLDSLDLDKTLESIEATSSDELKAQVAFANYLPNTGWLGTLSSYGIRSEDGLKFKVSTMDTLVIKGDVIDPTTKTIDLSLGWNWIGFISIRNQSIQDALANLNANDGDIIKGKTQFAVYNTQLGWVGSLQTLVPGRGYMYYSNSVNNFTYPFAGMFKSGSLLLDDLYEEASWLVDNSSFSSNMTSILSLETDCEYLRDNTEIAIGVFDETDICRGVSALQVNAQDNISFLTSAGDKKEQLKVKVLDKTTDQVYELNSGFSYNANEHLGSILQPFNLKLGEELCFKMQADAGLIEEYFQVYPTVISEQVNIDFLAEQEDVQSTMKLYNTWGQIVFEKQLEVTKGFNRITIDWKQLQLASGIYHLEWNSGSVIESVQLIQK